MEQVMQPHSPAAAAMDWAMLAVQMAAAATMQVVAVVQAAQGSAAVLAWVAMAAQPTSGWTASIMQAVAVAQLMELAAHLGLAVTHLPHHRRVVVEKVAVA
jgi:hypothetical protein